MGGRKEKILFLKMQTLGYRVESRLDWVLEHCSLVNQAKLQSGRH